MERDPHITEAWFLLRNISNPGTSFTDKDFVSKNLTSDEIDQANGQLHPERSNKRGLIEISTQGGDIPVHDIWVPLVVDVRGDQDIDDEGIAVK